MPENAQDRAAFTYNAAADFFDASPLSFWDYSDVDDRAGLTPDWFASARCLLRDRSFCSASCRGQLDRKGTSSELTLRSSFWN